MPDAPLPAPTRLDDAALDRLFRAARTQNAWTDRPVPDALLRELYGLLRLGPTAANQTPARFLFVRTPEGKARLATALSAGNIEKTMAAPVTAIVAWDPAFPETLPRLFPHADARSWFAGKPEFIRASAVLNSSLQAAYLILAARALGLDAGPMGGFDAAKLDALFFTARGWRSSVLVNLGYGDPEGVHPRLPRLEFEEAAAFA